MNATKIEWTDRTWNPTTGCTKVSPGCDHCYAEGIAHRFAGTKAFPNGFDVTLHPERLDAPLRWRKPARVFVNSMSDLFHDDVPDDFIAHVWAVMATSSRHTFQVLTKRHGRMRSLLSSERFESMVRDDIHASLDLAEDAIDLVQRRPWPLDNIWLGVSVEDQKRADLRIPALLDTPAAVRFLSCEPLLGPVDLGSSGWLSPDEFDRAGIGWVIAGGESGPGARPMHPEWARGLRDQCAEAGVPFFFKQWGEHAIVDGAPNWRNVCETDLLVRSDGYRWPVAQPHGAADGTEVLMRKVGKKVAGRELDGRTWDEFPANDTAAAHH